MQNHFVIFETVVAQASGDSVGVIPVVSRAGGIVIAPRHLNANEIRQLLSVIEGVVTRFVDDLGLLFGIRRRRWNIHWRRRRRSRNRQAGGSLAQFAQHRYGFRSCAQALQIFNGAIFQFVFELYMAQILGHLPVGLLELHRRSNEHDQLSHGQIHLTGGAEHGGRY
jgi:hypothetical protein